MDESYELTLSFKPKKNHESAQIRFGNSAKLQFDLDPSLYFLNHGSYGAVPKTITQKRRELQLQLERAPDVWFRYNSNDIWDRNIAALSNYLKVNQENLVLCFTATDAINAILKSIEFNGSNDAILLTQYSYSSVKNTIDYVRKYRLGQDDYIQAFTVPIVFPISNTQQLVDQFDKVCREIVVEKGLRLRLAIVDHIASTIPIVYPIEEISKVIRKWSKDALILIDGAHGIGQLNLDLNKLDCDYYVSNLCKWFIAPRGCTFLYFKRKELTKNLEPNYISFGYGNNPTVSYNFFARGTKDNTTWYVIKDCIDFYTIALGGREKITQYISDLLDKAVDILTKSWNTNKLEMPRELEAPFMKLVKLPKLKSYGSRDGAKLMRDMYENFKIIGVFVGVQDELYCRLSCFVYNEINDYMVLRDAINQLRA